MLNRIFVVDSVTLTSTGTAVSSYTPWDQTTRKLPTQVVVKATGQGAYVRLSNDNSAATNADVLVQGGDHVVLSVQGRRWVSVLSDGASSTVNVGALSTGVSGSAASLDLVFVDAGVLDPRVTFTRASTATYFNSAGVLTSAAINESRRDFDPATLAAQGLLIEEQRTNLLQRSEEFNDAYWNLVVSTSVTANATTAPNSTVTADKIVEAAASNVHYLGRNNVLLAAATTCSVSVFAKASERSFIGLQLTPDGTNYIYCTFNLATGVASTPVNAGNGSGATAAISAVGNGWYRCTLSGVPSSTAANPVAAFYVGNANVNLVTSPYLGDGTSGIFLWGAQLEAGAFPTSYIPTTTTALTRSADVASVNTLSPWFNSAAGTIYAESQQIAVQTGLTFPRSAQIDDGSNNNLITTIWRADLNRLYGAVTTGGVNQADIGTNGVTQTNANKIALAYATNDFAASVNGGSASTDTSGTVPTGLTALRLGSAFFSATLNGYLRRVTFYPRRLSNAELQAITA